MPLTLKPVCVYESPLEAHQHATTDTQGNTYKTNKCLTFFHPDHVELPVSGAAAEMVDSASVQVSDFMMIRPCRI